VDKRRRRLIGALIVTALAVGVPVCQAPVSAFSGSAAQFPYTELDTPRACGSRASLRLVYGPTRYTVTSGWAANQVAYGYRFTTGGSLNFQSTSGGGVSISFGFGAPWGSVGFSVPLGHVTGGYTGYSVGIPASKTNYYKVWVEKQFRSRAYQVFYCDDLLSKAKEYELRQVESPELIRLEAGARRV